MASITNPTRWPMKLPTGHIVPGFGSLGTTNDVINATDNWPTLNGLALSGQITLTLDPEDEPTAPVVAATPDTLKGA